MRHEDPRHLQQLREHCQKLSEKELTSTVLMPLFSWLGYERVEYFHGADEEGRDLVCWRRDELGDEELTVVLVKKYKPTRRAADKKSFSEIITQLSQAVEKELPSLDGTTRRPSAIYAVTPFVIDTKVLRSRFEGYRELRAYNIKILDGNRLARLISRGLPDLASKLCGPAYDLESRVLPELTNEALMAALEAPTARDIEVIYTDLDLALGRTSTQFFFHSSYRPAVFEQTGDEDAWKRFLDLQSRAESTFGVRLLRGVEKEVVATFERDRARQAELPNLIRSASTSRRKLESQRRKVNGQLRRAQAATRKEKPLVSDLEKKRQSLRRKLAGLSAKRLRKERRRQEETGDAGKEALGIRLSPEEACLEKDVQRLDRKLRHEFRELRPLETRINSCDKKIAQLRAHISELGEEQSPALYQWVVDGQHLAEALKKKRENVRDQIQGLNEGSPTRKDLKNFFLGVEGLFEATGQLLQESYIAAAIGLSPDTELRPKATLTPLQIPIAAVLDTGLNFLVMGEAGAGKTTSLQNYSRLKLNKRSSDALVLFVPLARMPECVNDFETPVFRI